MCAMKQNTSRRFETLEPTCTSAAELPSLVVVAIPIIAMTQQLSKASIWTVGEWGECLGAHPQKMWFGL